MQKHAKDYGLLQHRKNIGVFSWHENEVLTAGLRYKISSPAYCYSHSLLYSAHGSWAFAIDTAHQDSRSYKSIRLEVINKTSKQLQ